MDVKNCMSLFMQSEEFEEDPEYLVIEKKYKEQFGHLVPREILPASVSTEQIKDAMRISLEREEDKVNELLNIGLDSSHSY